MADFHVYQDDKGYFRWKLIANNGNAVASNTLFYTNEIECHKSAEFVKRFAPFANILTVKKPDQLPVNS